MLDVCVDDKEESRVEQTLILWISGGNKGDDGDVHMFLLDKDDHTVSLDAESIKIPTHRASVTGLATSTSQKLLFSCASDGG